MKRPIRVDMHGRTPAAKTLSIWVIYDHPKDYPGGYVARRWSVEKPGALAPTDDTLTADDPSELREALKARGCVQCLPRSPSDDRAILESWF